MKKRPFLKGLTLLEVLIVVVIVSVLAALIFVIAGSSRAKAREADEASRLRQLYLAVSLYEEDYDRKPPQSIVDLAPTYVKPSYLWNPNDARVKGSHPDWPANPWADVVSVDDPAVMRRRFKEIVSYAYIGSFEARFPTGRTMDFYRNEPTVGMITGLGLLTCDSSAPAGLMGEDPWVGCIYPKTKWPEIHTGMPAMNLVGSVLTVRMDGSIAKRTRKGPVRATMGFEGLFLFEPLRPSGSTSANP